MSTTGRPQLKTLGAIQSSTKIFANLEDFTKLFTTDRIEKMSKILLKDRLIFCETIEMARIFEVC